MDYSDVASTISDLSREEKDFQTRTNYLIRILEPFDDAKLSKHLYNAGVIPECYEHDSSEEKLYAKYCDILLYEFFKLHAMEASLYVGRGDQPDVLASQGNSYTIVGDAKAFRLSRTALNPKDFKIAALDRWRRQEGADLACLVGPIHDFPGTRSRLYSEAVNYNVTLISYTHLIFILTYDDWRNIDLRPIWDISTSFQTGPVTGEVYWRSLDRVISELIMSESSIDDIKKLWNGNLTKIAEQQIEYWEGRKKEIAAQSKEKLLKQLMHSIGIDTKIEQIKSKIPSESNFTRRLNLYR